MFGFLSMMDNYEDRKVLRDDFDDKTFLSTAEVDDADYTYETALCHPDYNDGKIIIIGGSDDLKSIKALHQKWKKMVKNGTLPDTITDNGMSEIGKLCRDVGSDMNFKRKEKKDAISKA